MNRSGPQRAPNVEEMLDKNDAALIIGDPGMGFRRRGLNVWDMAVLWRQYTGLGFVFAMWMVRDEAVERARTVDFSGARDEGIAHLEEIVASYKDKIPMPCRRPAKLLDREHRFQC